MRFEIGKYYKHTTGNMLHVITACKTTLHGWTHIAERAGRQHCYEAIGVDENSAVNFHEINEKEWLEAFRSI